LNHFTVSQDPIGHHLTLKEATPSNTSAWSGTIYRTCFPLFVSNTDTALRRHGIPRAFAVYDDPPYAVTTLKSAKIEEISPPTETESPMMMRFRCRIAGVEAVVAADTQAIHCFIDIKLLRDNRSPPHLHTAWWSLLTTRTHSSTLSATSNLFMPAQNRATHRYIALWSTLGDLHDIIRGQTHFTQKALLKTADTSS
jgi:hypothetical protein